jgi:ubiquinone/menaquinone biosynthesis C-methylase UbiE
MSNYKIKENYITRDNNPIMWRNHSTYNVLKYYKKYIKNKIIADLGSNHCAISILSQNFNPKQVNCFDLNLEALKIGYNNASILGIDNMIFHETNLMDIKQLNETFDFMYSFHVLEHIYENDIKQVINEFFRILKKGGYILISIPYDHYYPDPCHVCFYTEETLQKLFKDAGFITLECFKDDRFIEKNLLTGLFYKPEFNNL